MTPIDAARAARRNRLRWASVLVALAVVGVAVLLNSGRPSPAANRVLVAIELDGMWFRGSAPALELARSLSVQLDALGFDALGPGDDELAVALRSASNLDEAASSLGAAFIVTGHFQATPVESAGEGGYTELHASGELVLRHADGSTVKSPTLTVWTGATSSADASRDLVGRPAERAGGRLGDRVFDAVWPLLSLHPTLFKAFAPSPSMDEAEARLHLALSPARVFFEARAEKLVLVKTLYDRSRRTRGADDVGPRRVELFGSGATRDGLCARGKGGLLVKTAGLIPLVSPKDLGLEAAVDLETLVWQASDGVRTLLFTGIDLQGYATANANGDVALTEDLAGWASGLSFIDAGLGDNGQAESVRVTPSGGFSSLRLSHDGKVLATLSEPCRGCAARLVLLSTADGQVRFEAEPEGGEFTGLAFLSATQLLIGHTRGPLLDGGGVFASEASGTSLFTLDLSDTPPKVTLLRGASGDETLGRLTVSDEGTLLAAVIERPGKDGLLVFNLKSSQVQRFEDHDFDSPNFSPDGRTLAVTIVDEQGGDLEVAKLNLDDGRLEILTQNTREDRYPLFDPEGAHIAFETVVPDPVFPSRSLTAIARVRVE